MPPAMPVEPATDAQPTPDEPEEPDGESAESEQPGNGSEGSEESEIEPVEGENESDEPESDQAVAEDSEPELVANAPAVAALALQTMMIAASNGLDIMDLVPVFRTAAKPGMLQHLTNKDTQQVVNGLDWEQDVQSISAIPGVGFQDNPNVGKRKDYGNFSKQHRKTCKTSSVALALILMFNITPDKAEQLLSLLPRQLDVANQPNDFRTRCSRLYRSDGRFAAVWASCEEIFNSIFADVDVPKENKNVKTAAVLVTAMLLQKLR